MGSVAPSSCSMRTVEEVRQLGSSRRECTACEAETTWGLIYRREDDGMAGKT
jgi:hypothetical protein